MTRDLEHTTPDAASSSLDDGVLMSVLGDVIHYCPDAVLLAGGDGGSVLNRHAVHVFGLVMDEGTVLTPSDLLTMLALHWRNGRRPLRADEYPAHRALQGEHVRDDFLIYDRHTRDEVILRCSAQPIRAQDHIVGALITWTEISDLRRPTEQMQKTIGDRQHLLAIASRELQPLVWTMGICGALVQSRMTSAEEARALTYVNDAAQGAGLMRRLLANLLALTHLERQPDRSGHVDCRDVVRTVVSQFEDEIYQSRAEVTIQDLPVVKADRASLVVVLQNLLGNSLTYCHPERPCRITVGARHLAHETIFSVGDNGWGIDREDLDALSQPCGRTDAAPCLTAHDLGLDICRRMVSAHDGRLWAESIPRVGATFYFTLGPEQARTVREPAVGTEP